MYSAQSIKAQIFTSKKKAKTEKSKKNKTKDKYEELMKTLHDVDLSKIVEYASELGIRLIFGLGITPLPFLANGGLPWPRLGGGHVSGAVEMIPVGIDFVSQSPGTLCFLQ